ncbi:MAG: hypothetical protein HYU36_04930 [Planctomycetes bacterium]|nr:hypothetical protein [Planctomycetota bacterium]
MGFSLKENEAEARERLRAFWAGSSLGRPALHVTAERPGAAESPWPHPDMDPKSRDLLPEWHAWCADQTMRKTLYLAEAMPSTTVGWGSGLVTVAVLAGADYEYKSRSAWIRPIPDLWERPLPRFDPQKPLVRKMEACIRKAAEKVGERGFVNPPIMLDAMTNLSQFRTPEGLCLELLERPEDVRRWGRALTDLYIEAYDHFYRLVTDLGYGDTSAWLSAMAEGKFEAVQCDFSVMISPEMFERFVLPDLRRVVESLDYSLYHLDGVSQMRFLDLLRTLPRLNGIQWNPEPPAGRPVKWLHAFHEIRKRGFCLHVWCTADEAVTLTRELGPDGLLLVLPRFPSRDEADAAIRRIAAAKL